MPQPGRRPGRRATPEARAAREDSADGTEFTMASLVTLQGPNAGRQFPLGEGTSLIGRQPNSTIYLDSLAVSRQHARILRAENRFFVEDLGSSNGTYLNGELLRGRTALTERDTLQIGPYVLALRGVPGPARQEPDLTIRSQVDASASNRTLFLQNTGYKLQVVLEIAQHLAQTLELEPLLGKLLDHLLQLFPQADRGLVILCEHDDLAVRAFRAREGLPGDQPTYSRTMAQRVLADGVGILSEDVEGDKRLNKTATLLGLKLRSLMCVPLMSQSGRKLGLIQLDSATPGRVFREQDLEVLTALALQVTVVLENAALHAARLEEERLRQEVELAREIQQGYLTTDFDKIARDGCEVYARVQPAREMSGDLYDLVTLPDGRLAFFIGDVSGKGMPAALFMVAVRTLGRHLAASGSSPAQTLARLHEALAADNPSLMFVTLTHGLFEPRTGQVVLASAGHPPPLVRYAGGGVDIAPVRNGRLLGYPGTPPAATDFALTLAPGDTLVLYTDGLTESRAAGSDAMLGTTGLRDVVAGLPAGEALEEWAAQIVAAVRQYSGDDELQDDETLLLLRQQGAT